MPEIILITLAKNIFLILKSEIRNQKSSLRGCIPPQIHFPLMTSKERGGVRKSLRSKVLLDALTYLGFGLEIDYCNWDFRTIVVSIEEYHKRSVKERECYI